MKPCLSCKKAFDHKGHKVHEGHFLRKEPLCPFMSFVVFAVGSTFVLAAFVLVGLLCLAHF